MMPIWSRGFWSTMITTPLLSWSAIISPRSAACSDNLHEAMLLWRMISLRKLSCARIKIFAAFEEKRSFPPGYIASPITVFVRKPANERNWSESTRRNLRPNRIPKPSTRP